MSTKLLNVIKSAVLNVIHNEQLCDLRYGTVVSASPLKVRITNNLTLPKSLLVVPQHLTNYSIDCELTQQSESVTTKTKKSEELKDESNKKLADHTHEFTITSGGGSSTTKLKINNALKVGDRVALLREQGGRAYFILDRI